MRQEAITYSRFPGKARTIFPAKRGWTVKSNPFETCLTGPSG
jgi:hypothetical protein